MLVCHCVQSALGILAVVLNHHHHLPNGIALIRDTLKRICETEKAYLIDDDADVFAALTGKQMYEMI